MRKRILPALLAVLLCCTACGRGEVSPTPTQQTAEPQLNADTLLEQADVAHYDCKKRGHIFSVATCQAPATCYYCGKTQGKKGDHDFTHATCLQKRTCTVCGLTSGDFGAHLYTAASCAGPASCAVCGVTSGSASGHTYRPATCVSPSRCSVCMRTKGAALGHQWTGGSCTTPQVCSRCKRQLAAPGHRMTGGSCTQDAVCTVCGYTVKAEGHRFDENGVCTVCGMSKTQASRVDASEQASRAQASELQTQTTAPPIDVAALQQYGQTMASLLQAVHDTADDSITKTGSEREQMLSASTEQLRSVLDTADEALRLCGADTRLAAAKQSLESVRKAIRSDAVLVSFGGIDTVKTAVTIRSDASVALKAVDAYQKAIAAL